MADRPQNKNLRRGGPGRPKGLPNKVTQDVREMARGIVEDDEYRANLLTRLRAGDAPHMETLLHHYAYGKPKETLQLEAPMRPLVVDAVNGDDVAKALHAHRDTD